VGWHIPLAVETEATIMIQVIASDAALELLVLQKDAIGLQLHTAYRHYYAVVATQEAGDATLVNTYEVEPLEAEFQRVYTSILAYARRHEAPVAEGVTH
jgi:hypothetical protein